MSYFSIDNSATQQPDAPELHSYIEAPYGEGSAPKDQTVVQAVDARYLRGKNVASLLDHVKTHGVNAVTNANGQTPIHLAVKARVNSMIHYLIKYGADLEIKDDFGLTPLHYAVMVRKHALDYEGAGALEIMELLLDAGARVDPKALFTAVWPLLRTDVAVELVKRGGDVMGAIELANNNFSHHEFGSFCFVAEVLDVVERYVNGRLWYNDDEVDEKMSKLLEEVGQL